MVVKEGLPVEGGRSEEVERRLVQVDCVRVVKAVEREIANIIDGLEVYKNAFETVAGQLTSTGLQIIHELILCESNKA